MGPDVKEWIWGGGKRGKRGSLVWLICDGDMRWGCGIFSHFPPFFYHMQLFELGFDLGI